MIGDGVLAALRPREHCLIWLRGPRVWEEMVQWFADRPQLTRVFGLAELGFGLWWAFQQKPQLALARPRIE
jgi:hypothetical protein